MVVSAPTRACTVRRAEKVSKLLSDSYSSTACCLSQECYPAPSDPSTLFLVVGAVGGVGNRRGCPKGWGQPPRLSQGAVGRRGQAQRAYAQAVHGCPQLPPGLSPSTAYTASRSRADA